MKIVAKRCIEDADTKEEHRIVHEIIESISGFASYMGSYTDFKHSITYWTNDGNLYIQVQKEYHGIKAGTVLTFERKPVYFYTHCKTD